MMSAVIVAMFVGPVNGQSLSAKPTEDATTQEGPMLVTPNRSAVTTDEPKAGRFDIFDALARMVRKETAEKQGLPIPQQSVSPRQDPSPWNRRLSSPLGSRVVDMALN